MSRWAPRNNLEELSNRKRKTGRGKRPPPTLKEVFEIPGYYVIHCYQAPSIFIRTTEQHIYFETSNEAFNDKFREPEPKPILINGIIFWHRWREPINCTREGLYEYQMWLAATQRIKRIKRVNT